MNVLIVVGHPRSGSFCEGLANAYADGARAAGGIVRTLHLAQLKFDPDVHTISPSQQPLEPHLVSALASIEWAQHLVFVYPAWWGVGPARLKGFLDRILLPGRAFFEGEQGRLQGLMQGRTAHLITTLDMPAWVYRWIYHAPAHQAMKRSTLGLCGIRTTRIVALGPVHGSDAPCRAEWLERAERMGFSLRKGPLRVHQRAVVRTVAWLRALRLQFYPMSWMAYTVGALAASSASGRWDGTAYWFGYGCLFFVKAATVLTNERFDFETDRINRQHGPFNGGSRVLVEGLLSFGQLRGGTVAALLAAVACAAVVLERSGSVGAAVVLLTATVASLGYTVPPLKLSWRGWGELDVALTHSLGVMLWGHVLQGGGWQDPTPWALSLPLGLSVLPAIILSSLPDMEADRQAGKRTLAVRLGAVKARWLAGGFALAANAAVVLLQGTGAVDGALAGLLPWTLLHALLLIYLLCGRRPESRRGRWEVVCALGFTVWFVAVPLWHLSAG